MSKTKLYTKRNKLSSKLEEVLISVKNFKGEYEHERDYKAVFERIKDTNPFSVLVFYESLQGHKSLAKIKGKNPFAPEKILFPIGRYSQFYFIPEYQEMRVGSYVGSGYRSTQSVYALALALLSKKKKVPTHILILDNQATLKQIVSSSELIVQPHEVTQTVEKKVADKILKHTISAYAVGEKDHLAGIEVMKS